MNWNGFFDLSTIKDLEELKQLFRDCLELSSAAHVDILHSFKRERYPDITPAEYIEEHITLGTHNVFIDRVAYSSYGDREGEVGSSTFNSPSLFLFIYLSLGNLYEVADKYKLNKQLLI